MPLVRTKPKNRIKANRRLTLLVSLDGMNEMENKK